MSDNWIVQTLNDALGIWNEKFSEILSLITQSPEDFQGGGIWKVVHAINGTLCGIGYALLVLFFVAGIVKTCGSFTEIKKPEQALKLFVRFVLAKAVITYAMDLMLAVLSIVQGIVTSILSSSGLTSSSAYTLPSDMVTTIESLGFFESIPLWFVALLGSLMIWVLSIVMILSVYGRFFRIYLYTALAPIPLSSFAGEPTAHIGKTFLKSYAGVCMEGAVIVLACVIFSAFATNMPQVDISVSAVSMVWKYIGQLIFNMLILTGIVKGADRIIKEMMG